MTEAKNTSALKMPGVAWPTLALAVLCVGVWTSAFVLGSKGTHPTGLLVFVAFAAIFASFTPFHDATHRSVSRTSWINEIVGRALSIFWLVPFPVMRFVHLEHHRNTNDAEKDPDYWSGKGNPYLLPVRWLTQDLHYLVFYVGKLSERNRSEKVEVIFSLVLFLIVIGLLGSFGYWKELLLFGLLPNRMAVFFLAFTFDYLPHKPHLITSAEDPYKATKVRPVWCLTPLLLYQNYHLIHHLYPAVPFYNYAKVWNERKEALVEKGAESVGLFGKRIG